MMGFEDHGETRVGPAARLKPTLVHECPFDMVMLDADRGSYSGYVHWAKRLLRPGGILAVDKMYRNVRLAQPAPPANLPYTHSHMVGLSGRLPDSVRGTGAVPLYVNELAVAAFQPE